MTMTIHYIRGDATDPVRKPAVIAHVCNDVGAWGAGFVLALSRRWWHPERAYINRPRHYLGTTQFVVVAQDIVVANMVAQRGVGGGVRRVQDRELEDCLEDTARYAARWGATLHMPRIGCGLGGAKWEEIEPIVERACYEVDVFVYDP